MFTRKSGFRRFFVVGIFFSTIVHPLIASVDQCIHALLKRAEQKVQAKTMHKKMIAVSFFAGAVFMYGFCFVSSQDCQVN